MILSLALTSLGESITGTESSTCIVYTLLTIQIQQECLDGGLEQRSQLIGFLLSICHYASAKFRLWSSLDPQLDHGFVLVSVDGTNRVGENLQVSQYDLGLYRSFLGIKYRLKSLKYFVGYIM